VNATFCEAVNIQEECLQNCEAINMCSGKHISLWLATLLTLGVLISFSFGEERATAPENSYMGAIAQEACLVCHRTHHEAF
jgi:hypothetical protein